MSVRPSGPASIIFGLDTTNFGDIVVVVKDANFLAAHTFNRYYVSIHVINNVFDINISECDSQRMMSFS